MDDAPATSPPAKAPADDQSASWNPALRPDSVHAPAHLSQAFHNNDIDSSFTMDEVEPAFDSPPPRTSEDRHPLNDGGPRFVFDEEDDDDEFSAWQTDADVADIGLDDAGARTPLANERSATPQPPAPPSPSHESHDPLTNVAEDSLITPVEPPAPAEEPVPTPEPAPAEEPIPTDEPTPAPAEEPTPTQEPTPAPSTEALPPAPVEEPAAVETLSPAPAEEAQATPIIEHEQPDIETIDTEALHETNPPAEPTEEHTHELNYEHQGETTTLEEAVQESAAVPLAEDTDSPAIVEWGAADEAFDLGTAQAEPVPTTEAQANPEEAREIDVQTDPSITQTAETAQSANLDWGTAADDEFDLGGEQHPAAVDTPSNTEQETQREPAHEEDPAGAPDLDWGAAGDEDFSLGGQQPAVVEETQPVEEAQPSEEAQPAEEAQLAEETQPVEEAQPAEIQPAEEPQPAEVTDPTEEHQPEPQTAPTDHAQPADTSDDAALHWGTAENDYFNLGATSASVEEPKPETAQPAEQPAEEPDLDWGTAADDDLGFGAVIRKNDAPEPKAAPSVEQPAAEPDLDWGAAADNDFGFDATAQTNETAKPAEQQNEKPAEAEEKDLSALWAEALADDDLMGEEPSVDPSAFFLDDDEGFLDDNPLSTQNGAAQANGTASASPAPATSNKYAPAVTQAPPAAPKNPYAPQGLQTTNAFQPPAAPVQASPYGAYNQAYQQQPPQRPSMQSSAQSFADKAKGGYASPFDLPEDLAKQPPRKKIVHGPNVTAAQARAPPPRTSSMYSNASSPSLPPPASTFTQSPVPSPLTPSGAFPAQPPPKAPSLTSKPSTGDFFEDLPVVQKPRPSGRYTPQIKGPTPPPPMPGPPSRQSSQTFAPPPIVPPPVGVQPHREDYQAPQPPQAPQVSQVYAPPAQPQRQSSLPYAQPTVQQLQQPERLNPFPDAPQAPQGLGVSTAPPAASRYSPAPPGAAASRYSPAPPSAPLASRYSPAPPPAPSALQNRYAADPTPTPPPPKQPTLPFAPRTSSPLAFHSTPDHHPHQRPLSSDSRRASLQPSVASGDEPVGGHSRSSLELVREIPEQRQKPATPPPPPRSVPSSAVVSPMRRTTAHYTPQYQSVVSPPSQTGMPAPRRSQSQSPGATMKGPILSMAPIDRPASTNGVTSPIASASPYAPFAAAPPPTSQPAAPAQQRRRRTFSRDLSYVKPTDETVNDPLERWKGAPIFQWGLGGTILTSFPKEIPRYGTGTILPMVKCTPGEVKLQKARDICPLWEPIAKFPGPLKGKSKKKEVLTWLQQSIETMEKDYQSKIFNGELAPEVRLRLEEKILLWKVLEVFVEHDGHLEGTDAVNQAVRKIISNGQEDEPQLSSPVDIMGAAATTGSVNAAEPIDPQSVEQLRVLLLKGDREKAVWVAADKRLWGHAMLVASTMNKDIWKQVVQEFVRQEVRKVSGNNQSLAALYEVFAGNWEESIDELVPASARAGFQMVSKTDRSGANTNVFEGLDRWRETLLLIVNNRSEGDPQALLALGKLLAGYGRIEAAHVCYLFARSAVILGGADDPASHIVLLGADHVNQRSELGRDLEPILLTEIFEFAVSLSAPSALPAIPHLQAFKLAHAFTLAEYGYKDEAQPYCEAIAGAMKSTTRSSPYYNATLIQELDDLVKRLSEAPKDGSSSWISKPTMGKVSSSVWSSFNKFVAGEDSDANATATGGADTSPFARITGDTPSVSRSPSSADIYGTYSSSAPLASASTAAGSRYAPSAGSYAPRTSGEQPRSRYEPAAQSPYQPATQSPYQAVKPAPESVERPDMHMDPLFAHQGTPPSSYHPPPMQFAQQPKAQNPYAPSNGPTSGNSSPNPLGSPYTPTTSGFQPLGAVVNEHKPSSGYEPPSSNFGPPLNSSEPATSPYEPPASSYEPPSYQPYEPEPEPEEEKEEENEPKKKSFMDDDDDDELERRAAALKAQQKAEADRQADEAFRKAAEADGKYISFPFHRSAPYHAANSSTPNSREARRPQEDRLLARWLVQEIRRRRPQRPQQAHPRQTRRGKLLLLRPGLEEVDQQKGQPGRPSRPPLGHPASPARRAPWRRPPQLRLHGQPRPPTPRLGPSGHRRQRPPGHAPSPRRRRPAQHEHAAPHGRPSRLNPCLWRQHAGAHGLAGPAADVGRGDPWRRCCGSAEPPAHEHEQCQLD